MEYRKILVTVMMLVAALILTLVSCTVSTPTPAATDAGLAALNTIPVSRVPASSTPLSATPDPTPTEEMTPTPTIQPTVTETPAGIPLPPNGNVWQQVLWLYETNNGCRLPCWWGITPEQTEWAVAEEFLRRFDQDIYETTISPGLMYYAPQILIPYESNSEYYKHLNIFVRNGIVERMRVDIPSGDSDLPAGFPAEYSLSALLTTYGQPSEVWLSAHGSTPGGAAVGTILPFKVVLFYPDQGIAALYSDNSVKKQGDVILGCPQRDPTIFLSLRAPDLDWTFEELQSDLNRFDEYFLPLEESTEMDTAMFYEIFRDPDYIDCLETSASFWNNVRYG